MQSLPEVWVHRRPRGVSYGSLDGATRAKAPRGTHPLHVLMVLTRNEFRARYRAQALGILWSLLNPLVQMTILSVIFSHVPAFKSEIPNYPVYLMAGVVVWQWLSTSLNVATQSFITHTDIVKRTVFPRQLLPLASALSYGVNFAMEFSLLLLLGLLWPHAFKLSPALIVLPVVLAMLVLLICGAVLATSVLHVIYRDVAFLVTTALTLLYWLTPIIYPITFVPEPYRTIAQLNPIASIMIALRGCLLDGMFPSALTWIGMVVPSLLMLGLGWALFKHYERMVLDYV